MDEVSTIVAPAKKRTRRTSKKALIPAIVAEEVSEPISQEEADAPVIEETIVVSSEAPKKTARKRTRAPKKAALETVVPLIVATEEIPIAIEEIVAEVPEPIKKRVVKRRVKATRKIEVPSTFAEHAVTKSKAIAASLAPVSIENPIARELVLLSPFRFPLDYTQLAAQTARYSGLFYVLVGAFFTVYHAGSITPISIEAQSALLGAYTVGGDVVFSGDVMLLVLSIATIAVGLLLMLIGFHLKEGKNETFSSYTEL